MDAFAAYQLTFGKRLRNLKRNAKGVLTNLSCIIVKKKNGFKIKLEESGLILPKVYPTKRACGKRIMQLMAHKNAPKK